VNGPGKTPSVRRATPADLAAVSVIERSSFGDPWSLAALLAELESDALRLSLVAEREGLVCGYLMAWFVADQLHVLNIATAPQARRQGVGTALLREAAQLAREQGLVDVTLEVRRGNAQARSFYRGHGLREVGVRVRYYPDNGEDAIIMTGTLADLLGTPPG
jgi:ribosomal-protein-alanine N-acetyltransferase